MRSGRRRLKTRASRAGRDRAASPAPPSAARCLRSSRRGALRDRSRVRPEVAERAVALAETRRAANRLRGVGPALTDRFDEQQAEGETGGDGGREGAAGAVGVLGLQPRPFEQRLAVRRNQKVDDRRTLAVAAL